MVFHHLFGDISKVFTPDIIVSFEKDFPEVWLAERVVFVVKSVKSFKDASISLYKLLVHVYVPPIKSLKTWTFNESKLRSLSVRFSFSMTSLSLMHFFVSLLKRTSLSPSSLKISIENSFSQNFFIFTANFVRINLNKCLALIQALWWIWVSTFLML